MFQSVQFGDRIIIAVSQYDQAKDVAKQKVEKAYQKGAHTAPDEHPCDDPKKEIENIDQPNHCVDIELRKSVLLLVCQIIQHSIVIFSEVIERNLFQMFGLVGF